MYVKGYRFEPDALVVQTSQGQLKLQALAPEIIRVVYTAREDFGTAESLMMLRELPATPLVVTETADGLLASTTAVRLKIDAQSGAFTWTDTEGRLLVREPHDGAATRNLDETDIHRPLAAAVTPVTSVVGADGPKAVVDPAPRVVDRVGFSTTLRLEFSDGEAIYGLGQHEEGILNYRGHQQYLYQHNLKVAAPIIVSTRGYAMLWDSYSLAFFSDNDQDGARFWTDVDDEMDYYFIVGPEFDQIIGHVRTLTGRVPLLPRWALGYFQSKERYRTQQELIDIVQEHRRRDIPIDCVVQDWMTWPDELWGQKSFDPARYPDPGQLCTDLHELDARLMVSVWPNMHNNGPNQIEMRDHGFLLGDGSTYNAFSAEARRLYWKQLNDGYFRFGVDAWWADCSEPFEADWKFAADWKGAADPHTRAMLNTDEAKKYLDPEYINAYSLMHVRGLYEGQRGSDPDKRPVVLTRSSYPGQQRYGAVTWSGDVNATWASLRHQIADGLNFCLTGNPRWSCDIGAFFVGHNDQWFWNGDFPQGCADLGYRELYVRWLQFGAFLPMFRAHGAETPREPWRFGDVGDPSYDTIVSFINLRYRLLPYLYTLQGWETHRHYTTMRALAFDFRHDPAVYDIDDQMMIGPALMICPVTEPLFYGPDSTPLTATTPTRSVYLPAGCDWYDFWTGECHEGGQTIDAAAPLERLPIFVRAGSILPLGPIVQHAEQSAGVPLEVRVYPGADGQFDLYGDAGDGYGYEEGQFTWTRLRWSDTDRRLTVEAQTDAAAPMMTLQRLTPVLVGDGVGVGLSEQTTVNTATLDYRGQAITHHLTWQNRH
ncbi:glycoside hydrolase family 31 protein [Streptomyces sp. B21-101]|uniref:glycoside hydrolase family 31 protein n=1 Tax=Streptomyces sp. B21-101 TaxID=3039415 RepID=UPI002FF3B07E